MRDPGTRALRGLRRRLLDTLFEGWEPYRGPMLRRHHGAIVASTTNRNNDLDVNATRDKQLTNIRAADRDENVILSPPHYLGIDTAMEFIERDEPVEGAPDAVRVRKRILDCNARPRGDDERLESRGGSGEHVGGSNGGRSMGLELHVGLGAAVVGVCLAVACGSSDQASGGHGGGGASGGTDAGAGTGGKPDGGGVGGGGIGGTGGNATGGTGAAGSGGSGGTSGGAGGGAGASGSGGAAGSGGIAGAAGAQSQCASGESCVAAAPAGWTGPVALASAAGATAPACPASYPSLLDSAFSDVSAAPATCDCTAATPGLSACRAYLNLRTDVSGGACFGCSSTLSVGSGCSKPYWPTSGCSYVGCIGAQSWYTQLECKGVVSSETLPPPAWGNAYALCGAPSGASCSGGACLPTSSDPICIFRDGSQTCPAPFATQKTLYRAFTDTRACGCSRTYVGSGCAGTMQVFADESCATTPEDPTSCATINCPSSGQTGGMSAKFTPSAVTATCPAPTPGQTGALTETQPVTVCCTS